MLTIDGLTYRIAGRTLLERATVRLPAGARIGLVGRNGTGKSTLLGLIGGKIAPDDGEIRIRNKARIGTVSQETPSGKQSPLDIVLAANIERAELLAEAETATDPHRVAEIHERLADIDAHRAEARAATILAGLGFDEEAQSRPIDEFSGGWRMRVALAAVLFAEPDLLLLDEPTNHLDLEAAIWLEGFLANYPNTMLLVSHDRDLLNKAVDGIWHLEAQKLVAYRGGYDRFERTRREALVLQSAMATRQAAERKRIEGFIDRFRYTASKARQAQSRIKALAKMEPVAAVIEDRTERFDFPQPKPLAPPIVTLEGASTGYDANNPVLRGMNLRIDMDDRIALLGANGNGKTTLLRLLAKRLNALEGTVTRSGKLNVGYFAQNQLEELPEGQTAVQHMMVLMPQLGEARVRGHLGRFGLTGDRAITRIADLSGGEKARLLLATITRDAPHLLLLDEPTNHLDVDAREALVQALNEFQGAVILVSHDSHLVELTADRLWLVADGTCRSYDGDLDEYRQLLLDSARAERRQARGEKTKAPVNKAEERKRRADARAATAELRKSAKAAEGRLEKLQAEKAEMHIKLADPNFYDGPADKVAALNQKAGKIDREIEKAELEWLEAQAALEANDS
ncbi:MAG: ABC-F family ATP-binding cassette domain-containing protein [Alphaproteobacteria bacterium]|nr:ABC-F family ATP-binding cassette domain-containing protein [Alphaproteobacteria bacterium]